MGRKPSRWTNLPKGMRARPRGNLVHYYLDTGAKPRKEIPLGSDYVEAVRKWAELTTKPADSGPVRQTFAGAVKSYREHVLPRKAVRTRQDNEKELAWLLRFFNDPPALLDEIEPQHISKYMDWRIAESKKAAAAKNAERRKGKRPEIDIPADLGHVRANREKALFSHIWNHARTKGLTKQPNPCTGVSGFHEEGRDTAPDAELTQRVLEHADQPLAFAMRLADAIGQRPADVRRCTEADIEGEIPGGVLKVRQGKTSAKLRIVIEGDLAELLAEIKAFKAAAIAKQKEKRVYPIALLVNEKGQAIGKDALRSRFDKARLKAGVEKDLFQFRDYRAKVATEVEEASGTRAAQALLGHTTEGMTAAYIRHKVGKKVRVLK